MRICNAISALDLLLPVINDSSALLGVRQYNCNLEGRERHSSRCRNARAIAASSAGHTEVGADAKSLGRPAADIKKRIKHNGTICVNFSVVAVLTSNELLGEETKPEGIMFLGDVPSHT